MNFKKYTYIAIGASFIFVAFVLGFRLYNQTRHEPPRFNRETNVNLIQDWMTIEYIGKTYKIPPPEIMQKLGFDFTSAKISVLELAKKNNLEPQSLIIKIQIIITDFQAIDQKTRPEKR